MTGRLACQRGVKGPRKMALLQSIRLPGYRVFLFESAAVTEASAYVFFPVCVSLLFPPRSFTRTFLRLPRRAANKELSGTSWADWITRVSSQLRDKPGEAPPLSTLHENQVYASLHFSIFVFLR